MSDAQQVATDESGSQRELEALGYKQELKRGVNTLGHLALILSDITPTASLLVVGTAVVAVAGTGSIWAYIIGCFVALNVAFCMGELGSMFPLAGGLFSIVTRVLGRATGFVAMVDYIGQAVFLPASVAIGIGTYVHALNASISTRLASGFGMILVTLICLLKIKFNAWFTGVCLAIELIVVGALAVAGFSHWQQPWSILSHPVAASGTNAVSAIGVSLIITALATALFSVNGYDSGINFAEEVLGSTGGGRPGRGDRRGHRDLLRACPVHRDRLRRAQPAGVPALRDAGHLRGRGGVRPARSSPSSPTAR